MSARQKRSFAMLAAVWLISLIFFWEWWLDGSHSVGAARFVLNSALLFWTTVIPGYFVLVFARSRVADSSRPVPAGWRVAIVVTKAPSEPFSIVRETLEAMLAQSYPHDTWLADEAPSSETHAWCAAHGVNISTRHGIDTYQNSSWPRRTRCKEGNLAYFYDKYGYRNYDFVAQLDADHVPGPDYLTEILRPFEDPTVGYVSAPSICDSNAASSWSARGRMHVEGALHGALQAGYNAGLAPLCIGSHYAVRTRALKEIGGLGPELAEDHSTTLIMNAHGWRGVHALDAIAHGEGPPTFAAMATQEFQWSRSLTIILLRYTSDHLVGLSPLLKAQFIFSQLWYPLFSICMALSVLLPIIALATGQVWAAVPYPEFFLHAFPATAAIITLMIWVRRGGWFRPYEARVLSWEGALFVFARWPWSLLGVMIGAYDAVTKREFAFRVTPKGVAANSAAPFAVVAPYIGLSLACSLPVMLLSDVGSANGFYIFSLVNGLIYLGIAVVILVMHWRENGGTRFFPRQVLGSRASGKAAVLASALIVLMTGAGLRGSPGIAALLTVEPGSEARAAVWPSSLWRGPAGTAPTEVAVSPPNLGIYDPSGEFSGSNDLAVEHMFLSWRDPSYPAHVQQVATYAGARNRWLMLTVEPWPARQGGTSSLLKDVAAGLYDRRIDALCGMIRDLGTGVFVRWGHEMDLPSGRYPWATNRAPEFVAAYQHFVGRCRTRAGAEQNVFYVWSPTGQSGDLLRFYPGPEFVDWVGLSAFDCVNCADPASRPKSFGKIIEDRYERVDQLGKPIMVAEFGVQGGPDQQRAWLLDAVAAAARYPLIRMLVYFNAEDGLNVWGPGAPPDWRVSPSAFNAGLLHARCAASSCDGAA